MGQQPTVFAELFSLSNDTKYTSFSFISWNWKKWCSERKKLNNNAIWKKIIKFFPEFFRYLLKPSVARVSLTCLFHLTRRSFLCIIASVFVSQSNPNRDEYSRGNWLGYGCGTTTISILYCYFTASVDNSENFRLRLCFFIIQWQVAVAFYQTV